MKIKKFIASTLQEGKSLILKELGDDAIILSSRNLKKPGSRQEYVEIVAAIDDTPFSPSQKSILQKQKELSTLNSQANESDDGFLLIANQIKFEINSLKEELQNSLDNIKYPIKKIIGKDLGNLYKELVELGFSEIYATALIGRCVEEGISNYEKGLSFVKKIVLEKVYIKNRVAPKGRIINSFIGSTGSGKTTALIKLAIVSKLVFEAEVAVISADMYKVGGSEQLQTLCSIANIPFKTVYSAEELKDAVEKENSNAHIFIDCFGTSHLNLDKINELKELFKEIKLDETYLVLSLTNRNSVVNRAIKNFGMLEPTGLILSKSDETDGAASFIENLEGVKIPICYVTNGQKIPDDIEPATEELISSLIFNKRAILKV